ncbi:hypothetical protein QVA66_10690 [Staphylococcus chromogenes]|nr:hypothetical protein [Staphylococcus chromogenes]
MPAYRLKPRLPLWRLSLIVAAALLVPVPIDALLPQVNANTSRVVLGAPENDWTTPMNWPDGTEMICAEADDSVFFPSWDCDGTLITTTVLEGSKDEEETLRRAIRSVTMVKTDDKLDIHKGDGRLIETDDAIGMSVEGRDDHDGKTLVAVVTGERKREVSLVLWTALVAPERLGEIANPQESA